MNNLFSNIRFYVLTFSILLALGIFFYIKLSVPEGQLQVIKLTQLYAFISIIYIYLAILATPLTKIFTNIPFWVSQKYLKARRAIGVSAFMFGLLHTLYAFFGELGGFGGLGFLDNKYLFAVVIGFVALVILFLMAITSFDFAVAKLTFPRWKFLHRFVYLAAVLVLIHAVMLGSHFNNLDNSIPQILFVALFFLLILEGLRLDKYMLAKFPNLPKFGLIYVLLSLFFGAAFFYVFIPPTAVPQLGIHAAHIQLAKEAQNGNLNIPANLQNLPGLVGDRTRRYTVSFNNPQNLSPNQDVQLQFKVYDASSGSQIQLFQRVYEKVIHLIIVDNELNYFNHIHPDQTADGFIQTTQFPHPGRYHLYLDFQPLGAIEQQFALTLDIGKVDQAAVATQSTDQNLTKNFGNYLVSLDFPKPLKASAMSIAGQKLIFTLKEIKSGQPVTNLKPYLAAFGHLVMINESSYDYLHVHPTNLVAPSPNANGGPVVEFLPLGLYGPIKPGIYRVFAQFNPGGNLMLADFTVKVE